MTWTLGMSVESLVGINILLGREGKMKADINVTPGFDFWGNSEVCNKHLQLNYIMVEGTKKHRWVRAFKEFIFIWGENEDWEWRGNVITFSHQTTFFSKLLLCLYKVCILPPPPPPNENPCHGLWGAVTDRVYYLPWVYWGRKKCGQSSKNMKILLRSEGNRKTSVSVLYFEIGIELLWWN